MEIVSQRSVSLLNIIGSTLLGMQPLRNIVRSCLQLILHKEQLLISPIKLSILLFSWVIPYLIFANYLESCLLPLRMMCYTQSDLLSTQPRDPDFQTCVKKFFPNREVDSKNCKLDKIPDVLIRPDIPDNPKQILVIRTGPGSLDYRNFIRRTWKKKVDKLIPVVFVCATSKNETLTIESKEYRDILQFDFEDSYHNLSWKMMAIYGFVIDQLPSVDQIVVTNDDTIVNATALEQILSKKKSHVMLGKVSRGYPRIFLPWLTWHVPSDMYPNLCYPLFIQGSSFVLSIEGAKLLVDNVCKLPMVHLDDVFMGVLSNCVGLRLIHNEGFDKHIFDDFVVYHYQYSRHSAEYLETLWQSLEVPLQ